MARNTKLILLTCLALAGCGGAKSGEGWKQVSAIDGGFIPMVEVSQAPAQDGAVYRPAAKAVCGGGCFQVGFFVEGDPAPPSQSRREFFGGGGWAGYKPAAVYAGSSGEFTKWDCAKAGAADAPVTALCGEGAEEQLQAVLHLASRVAWTAGCGLPVREMPRRPGDLACVVSDPGKLKQRFAWQPRFDDIDTIVGSALAWERGLQSRGAGRSTAPAYTPIGKDLVLQVEREAGSLV